METQITLATITGLLGISFGVWSWLKKRDSDNKTKTKEFTELQIKVGMYKEELNDLKQRVDNLDIKVMQKIDDLSKKIDEMLIKLMDQWQK